MEQQFQYEEQEKIFSDKDFTALKEKFQNLYLNDDFIELLRDKFKELEKDINNLVCLYKALKGSLFGDGKENFNDCLVLRLIGNDPYVVTKEKVCDGFFMKKINVEDFTNEHRNHEKNNAR